MMPLTKLTFHIVETSDILGEDTLEGTDVAVEVAELDKAKLAQGVNDFSSDFI